MVSRLLQCADLNARGKIGFVLLGAGVAFVTWRVRSWIRGSRGRSPEMAGGLPEVNRRFYDALWGEARLVDARRFNTWPVVKGLLPGSPAIDAGDPLFDPADPDGDPMTDDGILYDQRGAPWARVAGGRIDMGAFEAQANPLPGDYNFDLRVDAGDYVRWRNTLGSEDDLRADGSGPVEGVPDGVVDAYDYAFWKANYGNELELGGGGGGVGGLRIADFGLRIEETEAATAVQGDVNADMIVVTDVSRGPTIRRLAAVEASLVPEDTTKNAPGFPEALSYPE